MQGDSKESLGPDKSRIGLSVIENVQVVLHGTRGVQEHEIADIVIKEVPLGMNAGIAMPHRKIDSV